MARIEKRRAPGGVAGRARMVPVGTVYRIPSAVGGKNGITIEPKGVVVLTIQPSGITIEPQSPSGLIMQPTGVTIQSTGVTIQPRSPTGVTIAPK